MNYGLLVFGCLVFLGLIFVGISIFRGYKKNKAIKHYEEIRDKLTLREQKEKEEEIESYSGFNIGNIIRAFIVMIVGFTLIGTINEEINNISGVGTFTSEILNIIPIFFVLATIGVAITMISEYISSFRYSGLI